MSDELGFGNPEVVEEEVDILLIGGGMAGCGAVSPRRMPSTNKSCPIYIGPCTFVPTHGPAHYPATVSSLFRKDTDLFQLSPRKRSRGTFQGRPKSVDC